jgi:hypothetical protein
MQRHPNPGMSFSPTAAATALGRCPRCYATRVIRTSRDGAPELVDVVSGPYPDLISAWVAAGILREERPLSMFVAGEMIALAPS